MSALGLDGYGSSDDDEDTSDIQVDAAVQNTNVTGTTKHTEAGDLARDSTATANSIVESPRASRADPLGPSLPPADAAPDTTQELHDDPSLSPYSRTRQEIRQLTMPPHPSFDIPSSPPPSNEPASSATNAKIARFIALKHEGVHFNAKLLSSSALRNSAMTEKLQDYAGIRGADQYRSALPEGHGVDVDYWASLRVEDIAAEIEAQRRNYEQSKKGVRREFVPAGKSTGSE